MIPLTIPEIKRLLAALTTRPITTWLVIHWDAWTPPPPGPKPPRSANDWRLPYEGCWVIA